MNAYVKRPLTHTHNLVHMASKPHSGVMDAILFGAVVVAACGLYITTYDNAVQEEKRRHVRRLHDVHKALQTVLREMGTAVPRTPEGAGGEEQQHQ